MKNTSDENLSEHAMQCAVLAHALAVINRDVFGGDANPEKAACFALFHDSAEVLCGDLPTPVKYATAEMRQTYKKIEENASSVLLSKLPEKMRGAYSPLLLEAYDETTKKIVKTADRLCALIKCLEERKSGNNEFDAALKSTQQLLTEYNSDELNYFLENFLPPFSKTLDEM